MRKNINKTDAPKNDDNITYKDYLDAVNQLRREITNACKKYPFATLITETIKQDGRRIIEITLIHYSDKDFTDYKKL